MEARAKETKPMDECIEVDRARVNAALKAAGYTQARMSVACGAGERYINVMMNKRGKLARDVLEKIEELTGVPAEELIQNRPPCRRDPNAIRIVLKAEEPDGLPPRYRVTLLNVADCDGVEVEMQSHYYPTYHAMERMLRTVSKKKVSDFSDYDNCMDENVKTVQGVARAAQWAAIADYLIERLTDDKVTLEELIRY